MVIRRFQESHGVREVLNGLRVLPQKDSHSSWQHSASGAKDWALSDGQLTCIIDCGRVVCAKKMAPAPSRIVQRRAELAAGLIVWWTSRKLMLVIRPLTVSWSCTQREVVSKADEIKFDELTLSDMGNPCNGPTVSPVCLKWASNSRALTSASSSQKSVKQQT